MILRELLQTASHKLESAGVEIPEQTARWLWQHVSGMSTHQMILELQCEVTNEQASAFLALVGRRERREPLQYVLEEADFAGFALYVDQRVLVPRPETEDLVALAGAAIEARAKANPNKRLTVMDLGTGSGAIAIALATGMTELADRASCQLIASDISQDALDVAMINARRCHVEDRIDFRCGDGFSVIAKGESLIDVLVANPPYIPVGDEPLLQPEVRDYEPHLALFAGRDGLDAYRAIASAAPHYLAVDATLFFEVGIHQAEQVQALFKTVFPNASTQAYADVQGILRVVMIQLHV
jgi:release factor glutamine methyltransferase